MLTNILPMLAVALIVTAMALHAYRRTEYVRELESMDLRSQRVRPAVGTVPPDRVGGDFFVSFSALVFMPIHWATTSISESIRTLRSVVE